MTDKVCLVTGATGSIGKALAAELAGAGAAVGIVARDPRRAEAVRKEIVDQSGSTRVEIFTGDLSTLDGVRSLAESVRRVHDRLDVLINNAAVYKSTRTLTPDGFEMMFAVNHLAPFLLTHLLLEPLEATADARILNVTAPSTSKLNFSDLQGEQKFSSLDAFGASKMANLLFTFAAAKRWQDRGVAVHAIHPGLVKSALMQETPGIMRFLLNLVSMKPEKASKPIVQVAISDAYAGQTGKFYHKGKEIKAADYAHQAAAQDGLWTISEQLTQVHS